MTRPTTGPNWATDASYSGTGDPWSGQPPRVNPGGASTQGFVPQTYLPAEVLNYILGNHGDWINNILSNYGAQFGDGVDGTAGLDGSTTYNDWSALTGGTTYTMNRDVFLLNLTLAPGVILRPAGFRLYVANTLTFNSGGSAPKIDCNGADGSGKTPGAAGATGTLASGWAGGRGTDVGGSIAALGGGGGSNSLGGNGGYGGASVIGSRTTGGANTVPTAVLGRWNQIGTGLQGLAIGAAIGYGQLTQLVGGGGGGGGVGISADGGGGGAGGGVGVIAARNIVLNNDGIISANGGNGAGATSTNGSGGGGGGGLLFLTYVSKTLNAHTLTVSASGGNPGAATNSGLGGAPGLIVEHNLGA